MSRDSEFDRDNRPESRKMLPFYIGAGVVAVGAIAGAVLLTAPSPPKKKKDLGLKVLPQCAGYEITDLVKLREALRKQVRKVAKDQAPDPFQVTSAFLRAKPHSCTVYPSQTRNPGEAEVYVAVFKIVTELLEQERYTSPAQRAVFDRMVDEWAAAQGVGDLPPQDIDPGTDEAPLTS